MAQPKPNEMPKIIALLAGIAVVLIFAAYRLFGGNSPTDTTVNTSGVPAITTATQPLPATTGAAATGTPGMVSVSDPTIVSAKPGQMRQFDPTLDADPGSSYPPVNLGARFNTFEKYKNFSEQQQPAAKPPINTGNRVARVDGSRLPGGNFNSEGMTPNIIIRPVAVNNTPQQEVTLDGVVTGDDGFAVLTIREPGRQNATIPDQKRFVRLGDSVGNAKIVEISELGLKLTNTESTWSVGDKRGVTRRNTIVRITQPSERASMPAMDAKLPMLSTP